MIKKCERTAIIFGSVIRSVLDSARQIFYRSLPSYLSDEIERIQRRAMRTVFFLTVNTVWH